MISETYKISWASAGDGASVWQQLNEVLHKVRQSEAYEEARGVYVKILFLQISVADGEKIYNRVRETLPKAAVAGMSLTMTYPETKDDAYVLLSVCCFENSSVTVMHCAADPKEYAAAGREFGERIGKIENAKAVEMFCVVLNLDLAPFVMSVSENNDNICFFGSLAGMNHNQKLIENVDAFFDQENINVIFTKKLPIECFVLADGFHRSGVAMAVFSGEELQIKADYLLGWKPIGKEMTVTETVGNVCVATIDNITATDIFHKYLNVLPDERFLANICDFPMVFERDGCAIARTPPIFDNRGCLYFTGDVHKGEKFRLAYANPDDLFHNAQNSAQRMCAFRPEFLILIICPNRAMFLAEDAELEIEPYRQIDTNVCVSHGPGEVFRFHGKGGVLNSSLIAVGMREGGSADVAEFTHEEPVHSCKTIPIVTRLATFLDATAKELSESNRELKDMAEVARAANEAKSQFLSNMSHEIRTPINAILGMDEMILREGKEETILEYAENIRMAGSNLLGLINDILDFSKIESGKLDIIPVEYSLSSVINDLVNMIQNRAEKKGLCFAVKNPPDLPSVLYGDEIRIKQVVTNILTNAVKYTERGFVALGIEYEKKDKDTVYLNISVSDSGIGIKEEDLQKLFSAFTRIEEKRNRTIEGTGLGMNITKQLLNLMDSELQVKSVYGKGSTFSFSLEQRVIDWSPMGDFDEAYRRSFAERKEYSEEFIAPDAHILVVDDTVMNLTVVKSLLKQTKVQIDTAKSGYECLEAVKEKKYDMIFLDHRMPGLDGVETFKAMKKLNGNLNLDTPTISLTANAVSGAREEYIRLGFKDYLTKPIDGHQLEDMMLKYLPPEKIAVRNDEKPPAVPKEELPTWLLGSGLDTAAGVRYCGSAEAYLDAVTVFAESAETGAKEIAEYYAAENWQDFTTKVHALKSTSRIIGAERLSELSKYLENAGNSGDIGAIKEKFDELINLYSSTTKKLAPILAKERIEDDRPLIDEAALAEAYCAIKDFAQNFDYDSMMFVFQSLEGYSLPEETKERYEDLRRAASIPDWELIRKLLM